MLKIGTAICSETVGPVCYYMQQYPLEDSGIDTHSSVNHISNTIDHIFIDYIFDTQGFDVKETVFLSGVQQSRADQYLELVRRVGMELRTLLSSVDALVPVFPASAHREVCT
jgi:hypothetical protein